MGQLAIHPVVPNNYNPQLQISAWGDIMPPFQLPSGKFFNLPKGKEWTHTQLFQRGLTHLAHNDVHGISPSDLQALKDAGKTYHSVPITPELLGIGASGSNEWVGNYPNNYNRVYFPNGLPTYQQGYDYGMSCDISHKWTIGETMENLHYTNPASQFWAGYYAAKSQRLDARFGAGNWRMAHDYLFIKIGPDWHYITESQAKAYFRNLPSLPGIGNLSGSLQKINTYTIGAYLGGPDRDKRQVYNIALQARTYRALGLHSVVFFDWEREWFNSNKIGNIGSQGVLYHENKIQPPDSVTAGIVAAGLYFGDGFTGWGGSGKVTNKIWSTGWMQQLFSGSFWVKNGESQQRGWQSWPQLSGDYSYNFVDWRSNIDMASFTAYAYTATLGQVAGGTRKTLRYKIDNGPWYNPVNTFQDDLCYAKYHTAPIVESEMANGKEALFFCEPCANNKRKTVTIVGQTGQQHTFEACGDMPHLAIWNV